MQEPGRSEENGPVDMMGQARDVLLTNDRGNYTVPSKDLYPHQWLWDSCFISIGQRHYDVARAQKEVLSLLRGQWSNGMMPNIIFSSATSYLPDRDSWNSKVSPFSPDMVATSGITQPPMLAEAVIKVGAKLPLSERRAFYRMVFQPLVAYHSWLYDERDPHNQGLVLQVHPWETGTDNTPPWMSILKTHRMPLWIRLAEFTHLDILVGLIRRDTRFVGKNERLSNLEQLAFFHAQRQLRAKAYNINKVLDHSLFAIEDLLFNSIFIRANHHLRQIAKSIREDLPDQLLERMNLSEKALDDLWDPYAGEYYSRDFVTHNLIKEPSIAALMPLYAGCITKDRAEKLVSVLENHHLFGTPFPVPSVPADSVWFSPKRYWQGPSWVNTNWLIIDGLRQYGYIDHAETLTAKTLEMVDNGGFSEYFDPTNGEPEGIDFFSWTAALYLDLAHTSPTKK